MDRGVREVHAPDGRVWWVKRAWLPRYRSLRDRVGAMLEGRRPRWWTAPLRWFAGTRRRELLDLPDVTTFPPFPDDPAPVGEAPDLLTADAVPIGGDVAPSVEVASGDFAPAPSLVDVGGGAGGGGGGGGGFDVDGDGAALLIPIVLGVLAAVGVLLLAWFVVVPLLLLVVDGAVLIVIVVLAGLVRLLFRRPWDVVAVHDRADGVRLVRRWEIRGFRRAGRVRDDVAHALMTGTDADLAVTRVLVREPRPDDPFGSARSVREH